ncbi:MAG: hypothetical protein R3E35_01715 [Rhodocyclaceae bacterium]|jgi:hypothetical protein
MKPFDITILAVTLSVSVLALAADDKTLAAAGVANQAAMPAGAVSSDSSVCHVVQDSDDVRLLLLYHNPGLPHSLPDCLPPQDRPAAVAGSLLI